MFEDDCTLNDAGVVTIAAALQALRGVQWDIVRLGRSDADPLGPVADDGEEVARISAVVADNDCSDSRTGLKRKRPSSPRALRVPIMMHHAGVRLVDRPYLLSQRGLTRLAHCGLKQNIMNVDDFLFACSADHPRRDLIHSPPVQSVRPPSPAADDALPPRRTWLWCACRTANAAAPWRVTTMRYITTQKYSTHLAGRGFR